MTQAYAIQLGDSNLFAAIGPDWDRLGDKTVYFEERSAAEQYRRQYVWEATARVVRIWVSDS